MRWTEINEAISVGKVSIKNLLLSGKSIKQAFADLARGKRSVTKGSVVFLVHDGQYALADGYHRLLQAILSGQTTIRGRRDASYGLYYAIPNDPWVFDPKSPTFGLETLGVSPDEIRNVAASLMEAESLELPDIDIGDEVLVGKFKNRKAIVKGFTKDDHNQPVLKTTKGDQKLFKPRLSKLMKEETLTEGLIAIPPKMLEHIRFLLTYHLLWRLRDRFKGKQKQLPEQYAAFKKVVAEFGETLPTEPYDLNKPVSVNRIPVNLAGMPANYQNLQPKADLIWFVIDWRPAKVHGGWREDKLALILYPFSLDYIERYPTPRSHADDLKIALDTLTETLTHELRHMVQFVLLGDHPEQLKMKPNYKSHGADYFTSPIEFDPTIGSAVQEFLNLWQLYNEGSNSRNGNLSRAVSQFTGMSKSGPFDTFSPPPFFKAMKKNAPERYQVAVKKFFKELQERIATQPAPAE